MIRRFVRWLGSPVYPDAPDCGPNAIPFGLAVFVLMFFAVAAAVLPRQPDRGKGGNHVPAAPVSVRVSP